MDPKQEWTVYILPSSHNDIGWAGTPAEIAEHRELHIFDRVLDIMERKPKYTFAMEAALYLEEYLGRKPHRLNRIQKLSDKGNLEWSGSYTQPYEGILSGEALLRQINYGRGMLQKRWGIKSRGVWNVDVLSRTAQIPQVFSKSGIDYLVLSRNKAGLYWWEAPEGSRVLVLSFMEGHYAVSRIIDKEHYSPLDNEHMALVEKNTLQEKAKALTELLNEWTPFFEKHRLPKLFLLAATADYTVPEEGLIDFAQDWNRRMRNGEIETDDKIWFDFATVDQYLAKLQEKGDLGSLPVVKGELPNPWIYIHGPCHEKTLTASRTASHELIAAEQLSVLSAIRRGDWSAYPTSGLEEAWKNHIYPDHGYGGLHGEGTDEIFRYKQDAALAASRTIVHQELQALSASLELSKFDIVVYNPLSWTRSGWVRCALDLDSEDGVKDFVWNDETGSEAVYELINLIYDDAGNIIRCEIELKADCVEGTGYRVYSLHATPQTGTRSAKPQQSDNQQFTWENEYYKATVAKGGLTELIDKKTGYPVIDTSVYLGAEIVEFGSPGVDVGQNEGGDADFTAYRLLRPYQPVEEGMCRTRTAASSLLLEHVGERMTVVKSVSKFEHCEVSQSFTFYSDSNYLDIHIEILNWTGERSKELRMMLPHVEKDCAVTYETPFYHIRAGKDELEQFEDLRPREVHNWIQLEGARSTMTLSGSCIAYDWIDPLNRTASSVLQAVLLSTKKSCHWKGNWYTQEGNHRYAFRLSASRLSQEERTRFGWEFQQPLRFVQGAFHVRPAVHPLKASCSVSINSSHVMLTAWKKSDDDSAMILRFWEYGGTDGHFTVNFPYPIKSAEVCTALEEALYPVSFSATEITLPIEKHAFVTLRVRVNLFGHET